jgi:beta-mannosidase
MFSLLLTAVLASASPLELSGRWRLIAGHLESPPARLPEQGPAAPVPSHFHLEGVKHEGEVWLTREVEVPAVAPRWRLWFEGVDYAAEIFWDGARVGGHTGYFAPFSVELPAGSAGRHLLAVKVLSPVETPEAFSLHKTLIKGVLAHHDTRPGGAWSARGQEANTGGIWGRIRLEPVHAGWVESATVITEALRGDQAELILRARIAGAAPRQKVTFRVLDPRQRVVASGALAATAEPTRYEHRLKLGPAQLWWPRELGSQPLYTLELSLSGRSGADLARCRFGIRTVSQDAGRRLFINGSPVFLRGTNYIGSAFLAQLDDATLRRDLSLMEGAHVNAVRVHAHVTHPRFYELADERGMLVWQDFPLQWGYSDAPAVVAEASRQASELVSAFGHHPSIVGWCGHNEPPWSAEWMQYKYPRWDPDQNRLLDRAVERALLDDPSRPVHAVSHTSEHAWMGWYHGSYRDFDRPATTALPTEFGAQAVPSLNTLRTFIPADALWPLEGARLERWQYHNFQLKELREIARVPLGKSVKELIENTQRYQARLIQFAAEALRRQMWQPVTGLFQFMFVEHWASISWGVLDHRREPKAGYRALARAYQPMLPVASRKPGLKKLSLHVINDTATARTGLLLASFTGGTMEERPIAEPLPAGEVTALERALPLPDKGEPLTLRLIDADRQVLAENVYDPGYFDP